MFKTQLNVADTAIAAACSGSYAPSFIQILAAWLEVTGTGPFYVLKVIMLSFLPVLVKEKWSIFTTNSLSIKENK